MSINYSISEDYGLMITESMLNGQCKDFAKQYNNDPSIADSGFYISDFVDKGWTLCELDNFESIDVQTIKDKTSKDIDESFLIIPCESTLSFLDTTYTTFEDIVNEFKSKFAKQLPDDFDYEDNLVIAKGIYWG